MSNDDSSLAQAVDQSFRRVAQHFAQNERFFRNVVVVPTNDARYSIVFRRDASSAEQLVLELGVQACITCPNMSVDDDGKQFFSDTWPCLVEADERSGEATVIEPTRCQHVIDDTSPRGLYRALRPLRDFVSGDATRRLYGVRKKFQDRGDDQLFPVGEPFSMRRALTTVSPDDIGASLGLSTWAIIGIVIGSLLLAVAVAAAAVFGARAIFKRTSSQSSVDQKETFT